MTLVMAGISGAIYPMDRQACFRKVSRLADSKNMLDHNLMDSHSVHNHCAETSPIRCCYGPGECIKSNIPAVQPQRLGRAHPVGSCAWVQSSVSRTRRLQHILSATSICVRRFTHTDRGTNTCIFCFSQWLSGLATFDTRSIASRASTDTGTKQYCYG